MAPEIQKRLSRFWLKKRAQWKLISTLVATRKIARNSHSMVVSQPHVADLANYGRSQDQNLRAAGKSRRTWAARIAPLVAELPFWKNQLSVTLVATQGPRLLAAGNLCSGCGCGILCGTWRSTGRLCSISETIEPPVP